MACVDDAVLGLTPDLLRRVVRDLADEHSPAGNATVAVMAIAERLLAACSGLAGAERARGLARLCREVENQVGNCEGLALFRNE